MILTIFFSVNSLDKATLLFTYVNRIFLMLTCDDLADGKITY